MSVEPWPQRNRPCPMEKYWDIKMFALFMTKGLKSLLFDIQVCNVPDPGATSIFDQARICGRSRTTAAGATRLVAGPTRTVSGRPNIWALSTATCPSFP